MDYGTQLQKLIDLSSDLNSKSIDAANGILFEFDAEWKRLYDLADHFKYLGFWKDYEKTCKVMGKLDAISCHFDDVFNNLIY